jgi:hypothetical protein
MTEHIFIPTYSPHPFSRQTLHGESYFDSRIAFQMHFAPDSWIFNLERCSGRGMRRMQSGGGRGSGVNFHVWLGIGFWLGSRGQIGLRIANTVDSNAILIAAKREAKRRYRIPALE